jgi:hypothetical protein
MTLADGSPIVRTSKAAQGQDCSVTQSGLTGPGIKDMTYNVGSVYNISFDTFTNGYVTVANGDEVKAKTTKTAIGTGAALTTKTAILSGTSVRLKITTIAGYTCSSVRVNGAEVAFDTSTMTATFEMPDADVVISATFDPIGHYIKCDNTTPIQGNFYANYRYP